MSTRRMLDFAPLVVAGVASCMFGTALDGYSQLRHPVSLLGGKDVPSAMSFNLTAFVVPGLLAAWVAWRLRARLPTGANWLARIGASLALLSAFAFATQGILPLDPADLDGPGSRLHYLTWMLWWISFVPAGLLLAAGLHNLPRWRLFVAASAASAILVAACALLPADVLPAGVVQRIGFVAWLSWCCVIPKVQS